MEQLHINEVNPQTDSPIFESISEKQLIQIG